MVVTVHAGSYVLGMCNVQGTYTRVLLITFFCVGCALFYGARIYTERCMVVVMSSHRQYHAKKITCPVTYYTCTIFVRSHTCVGSRRVSLIFLLQLVCTLPKLILAGKVCSFIHYYNTRITCHTFPELRRLK